MTTLALPAVEVVQRAGARYYRRVGSGAIYPSVTTVLAAWGADRLVPWVRSRTAEVIRERLLARAGEPVTAELAADVTAVSERATSWEAEHGRGVHAYLATALTGDLYEVVPELEPFAAGAREWLAAMGARIVDLEVPVLSERWGFGGTVDAVIELEDGGLGIVDWKTGQVRPQYALQLAAYWQACEEAGLDVRGAWVVRLAPEEWYSRQLHDRADAWEAFLDCLRLWRRWQTLPARWLA